MFDLIFSLFLQWESMVSEAPMAGPGKIDIKKWAKVITGTAEEE